MTEVLWGAAWGVALAALICRGRPVPALATGAFFGAALILGLHLRGRAAVRQRGLLEGAQRQSFQLGLLLAAGWGWGTALLLKLVARR